MTRSSSRPTPEHREFDGIQFPTRIEIEQGGFPVWELNITNAIPNAPFDLPVPGGAGGHDPAGTGSEHRGRQRRWHLTGGPHHHHSVLVEFDEYVAVVEAPENEVRSLAVIDEVRRLVPNKVIRHRDDAYHFDHLGGVHLRCRGRNGRRPRGQRAVLQAVVCTAGHAAAGPSRPESADADGRGRLGQVRDHRWQANHARVHDERRRSHGVYTPAYLPGPKVLVQNDAQSRSR